MTLERTLLNSFRTMGLDLDDLPGLSNPEIEDSGVGADQGSTPGDHLATCTERVGCLPMVSNQHGFKVLQTDQPYTGQPPRQ